MNRPVISATIAAGVLIAGPGVVLAATALADPDGSATANGAGVVATDDPGGRPHRDPYRGPGSPTPEFPYLRPGAPGPSGNSGLGMIPVPPAPRTPVSVISGGVDRGVPEVSIPEVSVPESLASGVSAPEAPVFSAPGSAALPLPQDPIQMPSLIQLPTLTQLPGPILVPQQQPTPWSLPAPGPAPAAPALMPKAARPPAAVAVPKPATPVAGIPELGSPNPFGNADIGGVAARALPGLAAILGMTAFGAVLGYRQAKAGHMLRAAGAARFLQ